MSTSALTRSARLYPIYAPLLVPFWQPVFFLYFNQHMSLDLVLQLDALYYVAVVILEVPSGYLSDTIGRRLTLIISSLSVICANALFFLGDSFFIFAIAQICMAAGMAFRSGTDISFHYDILKSLNRQDEYAEREARITRNVFIASAGAALIGGLVAIYALRIAYALSLAGACIGLILVLAFTEPARDPKQTTQGFLSQIGTCFTYLRQPILGWLMFFSVFMTIVNHIPYEFYQPYIQLLEGQHTAPTPLITGFHTAITMIIAAWFAKRSIRLRDRIGTCPTLLISAGLQTILIILMGIYLHPIVALLLGMRSVPRALMAAPLNAAQVPHLQQNHRATYLSIQSLLGRLSFSGSLILLAKFAGSGAHTDWTTLSHTLQISAAFALIGCFALILIALLIPRSQWQLTSEQ